MNSNRTFQELQDAIKAEMQLDPGLISDLERKTFINDCIKEIGRTPLFEKYADITITNGEIDVPDDFVELIELRYNHILLKPSSLNSMEVGQSAPVKYAITYNKIQVYPAIDTGIARLYYVYAPAVLSDPTDQPDIPNGYDPLIVDFAVGKAHRKNGNIGLYREYMSAFNSGKGELIAELLKRSNSRVRNTIDNDSISTSSFSEEILL